MTSGNSLLVGKHVRLEALESRHIDGLVAAAEGDRQLYQWSPVPQTQYDAKKYVDTALAWKDAGTAVPYATIRLADDRVIGSTRFWNIERWPWPEGHPSYERKTPDVCEIGYTWLTQSAIRTAANTEAKLLMLTPAIERIGGRFEGILRAHRMATDFVPRDSARFSIIAAEWPEAKQRLIKLLN